MKPISTLTALTATLAATSIASAQNFADQGTFIIAVDRALGYTHNVRSSDPDGPAGETTVKRDNVALLGQGGVYSPFAGPRASFDYFVIDGLSIGGSIYYWTVSGETTLPNGISNNLPDQNAFQIAPRIGYALMFNEWVGWWPRGGLSFFSVGGATQLGDQRDSGVAFDADLPFVFVPVEHAAILVGPALDVSLGASGRWTDQRRVVQDYSVSYFDIGLYAGLGFWL